LRENLVFFREFVSNFTETGSAFPTSRAAARAMTRPIQNRKGPLNIIEVGPGSGSVTVKILRDMLPGDTLMICEINPRFMKALKERLRHNRDYQRHQNRVKFFEGDIRDLDEDARYDVIVCAIPFLNFPVKTVDEIFAKLRALSRENARMTYYEYMGLRRASKLVSPPSRRERMRELDSYLKTTLERHRINRTRVWWNMLPIYVHTLKMPA